MGDYKATAPFGVITDCNRCARRRLLQSRRPRAACRAALRPRAACLAALRHAQLCGRAGWLCGTLHNPSPQLPPLLSVSSPERKRIGVGGEGLFLRCLSYPPLPSSHSYVSPYPLLCFVPSPLRSLRSLLRLSPPPHSPSSPPFFFPSRAPTASTASRDQGRFQAGSGLDCVCKNRP